MNRTNFKTTVRKALIAIYFLTLLWCVSGISIAYGFISVQYGINYVFLLAVTFAVGMNVRLIALALKAQKGKKKRVRK